MIRFYDWLRRLDLNQRLSDYEPELQQIVNNILQQRAPRTDKILKEILSNILQLPMLQIDLWI